MNLSEKSDQLNKQVHDSFSLKGYQAIYPLFYLVNASMVAL